MILSYYTDCWHAYLCILLEIAHDDDVGVVDIVVGVGHCIVSVFVVFAVVPG